MNAKWYFEDFEVGKCCDAGHRTVTKEEIVHFATQFDPQSFHVDPIAAAQSIYGGIIASGWHTCSLIMRMVVDNVLGQSACLGSPGIDKIQWLKPLRGGDTLHVKMLILEAHTSANGRDRGLVVARWEASNQRGELMTVIEAKTMFRCRPA
jgi:acyl dehydratase